MSIQPDSSSDDLDRTDELPVLDVAAYETSLAESQKGLSRTDAWTVEALRDMDELVELAQRDAPISVRNAGKESIGAEALTVNVERILKRIAELEADIRAAHEANAALLKGSNAIQADRDQQALRIQALEGENARLQDQLHASIAVANQRAESLAALEKSLSDEKTGAAHLARQLAAKLTDCEMLGSVVDLRNRTIDDLTRARDDLSQELQRETASGVELAKQLAATEQSLHENRAILHGSEDAIAERNRQLTQLTQERDAAQAQIRDTSEARDALLSASTQLAARTAELEQTGMALAQLQRELAAAHADARSRTQLLKETTDELNGQRTKSSEHVTAMRELEHALRARDELAEGLKTQLRTVRDERTIMTAQLDKVRARVKSLTQHIFSRDNQIAELQADLAVHTEALAAIRRDVNRIGESADSESFDEVERMLEPIEHTGTPILLTGKTFTVGRTAENDICIPSNLISRRHARLLVGPTGVIIEDAGSTNGCFVNGEQVRQHLMRDGDVLELGDLRYRLRTRSVNNTRVRARVAPTLAAVGRTTDRGITVVPTLTL